MCHTRYSVRQHPVQRNASSGNRPSYTETPIRDETNIWSSNSTRFMPNTKSLAFNPIRLAKKILVLYMVISHGEGGSRKQLQNTRSIRRLAISERVKLREFSSKLTDSSLALALPRWGFERKQLKDKKRVGCGHRVCLIPTLDDAVPFLRRPKTGSVHVLAFLRRGSGKN